MRRILPALMLISLGAAADWVLINPFPGSGMKARESKKDQKLSLPNGTGRTLELQGRVGRLVWKNPRGKTTQELYDFYAQELSKGGFKPLYACAGKECGAGANVPNLGKLPASADSHFALAQLARRDL